MKNNLLKKADVILIAVILGVLAIFLMSQSTESKNMVATISIDGKIVDTIDLSTVDENHIKSYLDGDVQLEIGKDKIAFLSSSCHSQICVDTGILDKSGDTAVCLPNKVLVTVKGTGSKNQFQTY